VCVVGNAWGARGERAGLPGGESLGAEIPTQHRQARGPKGAGLSCVWGGGVYLGCVGDDWCPLVGVTLMALMWKPYSPNAGGIVEWRTVSHSRCFPQIGGWLLGRLHVSPPLFVPRVPVVRPIQLFCCCSPIRTPVPTHPHHHNLQVKVLSGGEKARLALAKFMCTKVRQDSQHSLRVGVNSYRPQQLSSPARARFFQDTRLIDHRRVRLRTTNKSCKPVLDPRIDKAICSECI